MKQNTVKDSKYEVIISSAKKMFLEEGRIGATSQEIADYIGISRTLLNYYFRSRDSLVDTIIQDLIRNYAGMVKKVWLSGKDFKNKIIYFIELVGEQCALEPFKDFFFISENVRFDIFNYGILQSDAYVTLLYDEIDEHIQKGVIINSHNAFDFISGIMAVFSYPLMIYKLYVPTTIPTEPRMLELRKDLLVKAYFKD